MMITALSKKKKYRCMSFNPLLEKKNAQLYHFPQSRKDIFYNLVCFSHVFVTARKQVEKNYLGVK